MLADDEQQWWVKHETRTSGKSLVNELVVGRLGKLIGAPVCDVALIDLASNLLPYELRSGELVRAGTCVASRHLGDALVEVRPPVPHRTDDDNRRRHAGLLALVDWCFGRDVQHLQDAGQDFATTSHDHGQYFPLGPGWDPAALSSAVHTPVVIADDPTGLDIDELHRLAHALRAVERRTIHEVLLEVPPSWPVTDSELRRPGQFLEVRAAEVAVRIELLIARLESI
nr:HipA family kinase [Quadrisphaera granulorum]